MKKRDKKRNFFKRFDTYYLLVIFVVCMVSITVIITKIVNKPPVISYAANAYLHVNGNHFADASGNQVVLRGAARWSLEFSCGDGHFNASDFQAMKSWGMNTVRLPLNENYFLYPGLCNNQYQNTIQTAVKRHGRCCPTEAS